MADLYDDFNYTLTRESPETRGEFEISESGSVTAGWEIFPPPAGPDGVPYQLIFVGPTDEHRGTAIRLKLAAKGGGEVSDDADVLLETFYQTGEERTVMFEGKYGLFREIPDQEAANAAVSLQKRAEAGEDYVIRLGITVPEDSPQPDPAANASYFQLECVKLWWNETA
ncbi:MAG: hypothetical protein VX947_05100 [Chloroflexota bacterium]|nr:hypothetical protein [Chloroflexota bacterium]